MYTFAHEKCKRLKMKRNSKKSILLLIIIGCLLIGLASIYLGRNALLKSIVNEQINRIENTQSIRIRYNQLEMKGLNRVVLTKLSVVPMQRDTLLTLDTADIKLSIWKLLAQKIEIRHVTVNGLNITFSKQDSIANYDFLFRKEVNNQAKERTMKANYAERVNKILSICYGFLPQNGQLTHIHITERKDHNFVSITIPALTIKDNHFESAIEIKEDTLSQDWMASGELNQVTNTLKTKLYATHSDKLSLPYIHRRFEASVTLDTIFYSMTKEVVSNNLIRLSGKATVTGLDIFHKALSPEIIHLNRGQLNYLVNIEEHSMELDSATTVLFNKIQFHPYLKASKKEGKWHFRASVNKSWFPADELFGSLPKGLFSNLEGIKTSGKLDYHFLFDVDLSQPDSLKLESSLKEKNFRIISYGATSLAKMAGEFSYTAYENGIPVRTFPVGPSWEHFTPLDSISPLLQMSVMQSEDGAFFHHNGFLLDAMREALIYDLKVKRFARGGSTITMQLVKNVFLNRNKNFARKLEEALIVWLIETKRLTSKERMYEVYLNIAEWGPLIYGIQEASDFYFNKRPSQLTTEECIFLASIIPKPKHFKNSFTTSGKLKETLEGYYKLISGRLAKKGLINEIEADSIRPNIQVTGKALNSLIGETPESSSPTNEEQ